ncbi:MAG: 16S rRNA (guanine(966)-N(2))-methyltransferase RsmD [Clostridia bacterium]|nr:16S rRNA (guanine(966)-N(2))-methyltransferase RsmD [Clostridia bacterium]
MPRVITGEFRGTILAAPKGDATRPTTDKVKEAIFSMIQTRIPDAKMLDLFSGTGQMGIEAISRGAESAVLVDKGGPAIKIIIQNLEKVRIGKGDPRVTVMRKSATQALTELGESGRKFDIIYLDPPYKIAFDEACKTADLVTKYDLLENDGIMIVEHASDEPFNIDVINMKFERSCSYGLCVVTFFSKN